MNDTVLTQQDRDSLRKLFTLFHERARQKGFHAMSNKVHGEANLLKDEGNADLAAYILASHRGNRLALIGDEITEAREEIRKGKLPDELYTSETHETTTAKPEGYLTEMADVLIRFGDTIAEEDYYAEDDFIELFLDVLEGKIGFNSQRSHMNGGKKF
jgi:hypothetical protein